nr:biopolymer transporter ExbD [Vannielia litorea]
MEFSDPPRRSATESVLPMINVVFLLLIFFLMTSSLAPPEPIEVAPPQATGEEARRREAVLYIGPDGTLAFGAARGEAALAGFVAVAGEAAQLRADAAAEAVVVARVLGQLAAAGLPRVELVAVPR